MSPLESLRRDFRSFKITCLLVIFFSFAGPLLADFVGRFADKWEAPMLVESPETYTQDDVDPDNQADHGCYPDYSRTRHPKTCVRGTDLTEARRFAKGWNLEAPSE